MQDSCMHSCMCLPLRLFIIVTRPVKIDHLNTKNHQFCLSLLYHNLMTIYTTLTKSSSLLQNLMGLKLRDTTFGADDDSENITWCIKSMAAHISYEGEQAYALWRLINYQPTAKLFWTMSSRLQYWLSYCTPSNLLPVGFWSLQTNNLSTHLLKINYVMLPVLFDTLQYCNIVRWQYTDTPT